MNQPNPNPQIEGIAVIGMAGKFPGARDLEAFWNQLVEAREGISTFERAEMGDEELKDDPDYVASRGIIEHPEWFDAEFFGMSPREAEVTDPQQRLFLEMCWHALEDAAVDPSRSPGLIGVYAGMSNNSYFQSQVEFNAELRQQVGAEQVMIGNEKDYLATRVAYKLNLRGPALNIYTACSTSLVAVCQAVSALQSYQCDVALAGGVSVKFPQERGYVHQEGSLFSPDGHCRAFDEKAQGTVFGNGLGVVVLKRTEDALRDGDRIYAVIRGAALNNDGADKVSFTAPSVSGHAEVICLAQALAGVEPDTIDYIEAHGTGTPIGDPIEVAGLTEAFRAGGCMENNVCALGSVKTNIGHLDAAAGVAGLIKTVLALHHKTLPASLHFTRPNPALELESSPFYVNATTQPWERKGHPRRAGVSAFGLGGTNAHVILEEPPDGLETTAKAGRALQLITLAAKSEAALDEMRIRLAHHLERQPSLDLKDVAATLQQGRRAFPHRLVAVAESTGEAVTALQGEAGKEYFMAIQKLDKVPVAFLFPGQGSQHLRMGEGLYKKESAYRATVDECAKLLEPFLKMDLRTLLYPAPGTEEEAERKLGETRFTQPALFVAEYALAKLLISWDLKPSLMLGHSIGEYVAACLAGVMSLADALKLVAARGRILWSCEPGAMLGVRTSEINIQSMLVDGLDLAAVNSPNLVVVAGREEAVQKMELLLKEREISFRRLVTSHAFHSVMMESGLAEFRKEWSGIVLHPPQIAYVSNVTGNLITDEEATSPEYYVRHIRRTVRFADGVQTIINQGPSTLLEVGPGQALATMARQNRDIAKGNHTILSSARSAKSTEQEDQVELMKSVGSLWLSGVELNWAMINGREKFNRVALPLYPFQRKRYCAERFLPNATVRVGECAVLPLVDANTVGHNEPASAPSVPAPQPQAVALENSASRKEQIIAELRRQLHRSSGIDLTHAPATSSFFDLGFDSLFLTQASIFLKKHFGVKITFRQLAEEMDSIDALAKYLDQELPADRFAPAPQEIARPVASTTRGGVADHLAAIEDTLARLRAEMGRPTDGQTNRFTVRAVSQNVNQDKRVAFGPFRPIQTAKDGSLTEQQRAHLQELVFAYTLRTGKSKAFTNKYRPVFSDPRAVAGFNHLWKEAVYPLVVDRSLGGRIWDIDGNEYIDVTQGFGVGFLGHRPSFVVDAIKAQLEKGMEIGPTNPLVGEVAELILEFTGMERVSFCDTGSEAVMAAIRTARTVSGRDKIVMFAGAYHGIMDEVLVRPMLEGDQLRTIPIAPGIPEAVGENILVLDFDNPESLEIIREHGDKIAAVLVETVQSRRPDLQPAEFLRQLRKITREAGIALVLDEVVNGFRIDPRGAAGWFDIEADIATYGKILGGGLPIGVVAGKRKYMDALDGGAWTYGDESGPEVGVTFFAGTFVRHPLALAAARAVLLHLKEKGPALQQWMNTRTEKLVADMNRICDEAGVPIRVTHFSSYFFINVAAQLKNTELLFHHMRMRGIHIWAGRSSFLCTQHTEEDIAEILTVWKESIVVMQAGGFLPCKETSAALQRPAPDLEVVASFMPGYAPLTSAQQELLLASTMSEDASVAYHEGLTVSIRGDLKPETLHEALGLLVQRHDSLRASFTEDGEGMQIAANVRLPMPVFDLQHLSATEQKMRCAEIQRSQFLIPFSLNHPPLLRAALLVLGSTHHLLVITAHHLVCDGWSFGVLVEELPKAYECAARSGRMDAPATRFDVYAADQATKKVSGEFDAALNYWMKQLDPAPAPLSLPLDQTRTGAAHESFGVSLVLRPELFANLKAFCRERKLSLFHVLLGTWQVLLHRLSGQAEFVVGVPFAGQPAADMPNLVGHCVQFLPIRATIQESVTALEHLEAVKRGVMDAMEHQECTWGDLMAQLTGLEPHERQALASVIFSLEKMPTVIHGAGLSYEPLLESKPRSTFLLALYGYQSDNELRLTASAQAGVFREETIQRWLHHYETLLEGVCQLPEVAVDRLPLLTKDERGAMLLSLNSQSRKFGGDTCLHTWFEQTVLKHPDAVAVKCGDISLTYAELNRQANRIAHALIRTGVRPGTLVGLCLERDATLIPALLGILKAGAGYVPLDPQYPAERMAFMLRDAEVSVMVATEAFVAQFPSHFTQLVDPTNAELLQKFPHTNPATTVNPDDTAYVIYTSGSTGKPKGCVISHRNVARLMQGTDHWFHFDEQDTWTLFHSVAFDFSVWEIWGALLKGGKLIVVPFVLSRSPDEFFQMLAEEKVTVLNQTPSAFRQLILAEEMLASPVKLSLRFVIFGGEALEMKMLQPWFERHGDTQPQLVNMYGITETTVHVTYRPLSTSDARGGSVIGVPIPDLQIYILDRHQEPVPVGVAGEMYVGGAGLAQGYLNRSELTAERFIPDHLSGRPGARLYRTGDLARVLPGRDLEFLGRIDQQVKIRGFRIELGEIESCLRSDPGIRAAAVVVNVDDGGEKSLAAFVLANASFAGIPKLREHLGSELPDYMVPASIRVIERFPLTSNGKLDVASLLAGTSPSPTQETPEKPSAAPAASTAQPHSERSPLTETEQKLAEIWADQLKVSEVGVEDNFFHLGGTSLHGLRLFNRIRSEFNITLPLGTLFRAPTLRKLAAIIDTSNNATKGKNSPLTCIQPAGDEIPFFGIHGGDGGALFYRGLLTQMGTSRPIYTIESPALVDDSVPIEVAELEKVAAQYIALVRSAQRRGPYVLGGYSYGGIVAYEMARQLLAAGDEIALLVLFDTENPNVPAREYSLSERISVNWKSGGASNIAGKLIQLGGRFGSGLVNRIKTESETATARKLLEQGVKAEDEHLRSVQIREASVIALESYRAQPLHATMLLFRSDEVSDKFNLSDDYDWTPMVDRLVIERVPGGHLEIFDEPHVSIMAEILRRRLRELVGHLAGV